MLDCLPPVAFFIIQEVVETIYTLRYFKLKSDVFELIPRNTLRKRPAKTFVALCHIAGIIKICNYNTWIGTNGDSTPRTIGLPTCQVILI